MYPLSRATPPKKIEWPKRHRMNWLPLLLAAMMLRRIPKGPKILGSSGLCRGVYVETFLDRRHG